MILFIDNYDSYVYNLVQYVSRHRTDYRVVRNDTPLADIDLESVDRIILSPGPCGPLEAGLSNTLLRTFGHRVPMLGICLGHQCLGHVFGMTVERAREVVHGKSSWIEHQSGRLFRDVPRRFEAGRYHSLIVTGQPPDVLRVNARLQDGTIMGLEHRSLPLFGLQFHPESILTPVGRTLLANFLEIDVREYPALGDAGALKAATTGGVVDRESRAAL